MYNVLENVLNNADRISWYTKLGCTGEGRCLMLCDMYIRRGATWQCISEVYCFSYRLVFQFGNTQFCASIQQDHVFCLHICMQKCMLLQLWK